MFMLFVFVTASGFFIIRAGEYNDDDILVDQITGDVALRSSHTKDAMHFV